LSSSSRNSTSDARVDINLTANRPPVDSLYAAYTASPSLSTLNPLLSTLQIHQHVFQLSQHLRTKLNHASATAQLLFSAANSSSTPSSSSSTAGSIPPPSPPARGSAISFTAVSVTSLEDELLSERIVKTFNIHLPQRQQQSSSPSSSSSSSPSSALPCVVQSDWKTERNKLRGLGIFSYSMRVIIHIPIPLTAQFPSSLASAAASSVLSPAYASFVLTDVHDAGTGLMDSELLDVLPVLMHMAALSRREFAWLLAVLCTFPSDPAFDVLSDTLMQLKPITA
jgi:hypothetical protein